jgi:type VI secretion system protein ImpK
VGEPRRAAPFQPAPPEVRLLWEADAVLALVPQLRATGFVSNLAQLRQRLAGMLLDFQAHARTNDVEASRVTRATEVLAALIDHVVTSMPWGADADWQSLGAPAALSGGRRPAQRLLELARASPSDAGISELIGVALALGFDGRSHDMDGPIIDQVRGQLTMSGSLHGEGIERSLSPQWQSAVERGNALTSWLPLWVSSLVVAALLAALFSVLELSLGAKSDRLYARMAALNGPAAATPRPLPAPQPRLAGALSEQIAARSLSVRDEIDRSVIVLPDGQLFEAGDATLRPGSIEWLRPIAAALQRTPGRIQIIGHTDGTAVRSARYPSDWELSVDRARAVQEALRGLGIAPSRLGYDGRASIEPLRVDDRISTIGGDGRIEIVLLAGR